MIVTALMVLPAHADPTDELARLRQEAARMRQSLDVLDARIRALENGNSDARAPSESDRSVVPPPESTLTQPMPNTAAVNSPNRQSVSPLFLLQRNWSEIKSGTSKEQVDALLGKPERVMRINGDLVWYYVHPGFGRGTVFFDDEGKVSGAQSPHIGWSW
ncbi:MAG: outer membrane protein assembly factor BamE [Betaproteobacteria bacterium]|nr:outer membrane protein assembly factor BamE [Betaproteobacteria bacterium]